MSKPKTTLRLVAEEETQLDHNCKLNFEKPTTHYCLTSVIATISHNSRDEDKLVQMMCNGMRIARLNMNYETYEYHSDSLEIIRRANRVYNKIVGFNAEIAIAVDIKGPQVYTGYLENATEIEIRTGDVFRLTINEEVMTKGNRETIYIDYADVVRLLQPGHRVIIDEGEILLQVQDTSADGVMCNIVKGGKLRNHKCVQLPDIDITMPALTDKDRKDIKFAVEQKVDMIFASAMRSGQAVREVRKALGKNGASMKVIAKVEGKQALNNIKDIITASDGIIFARTDVSLEISKEKLPLAQKAIFSRCNKMGRPAICATGILKSMMINPEPNCSEVLDLANAITDGADCVMLSGVTCLGKYPLEVVTATINVCREAELALWHKNLFQDMISHNPSAINATHAVAIAAVESARKALASAIIVLTISGRSADLVSRYKPRCPIFAVTKCPRTHRQGHLFRGIIPILLAETPTGDWADKIDSRVEYALSIGKKLDIIKTGDAVVVLAAWKSCLGFTNVLRLLYAYDQIVYADSIVRNTTPKKGKKGKK